MEQDVQTVIVVLAMGAFLGAAYVDVRRRRIPNALSYMIGSLGLLRMLLADDPMTAGWTLAAAAGVLVVGFMFFWGGTLGGGSPRTDEKSDRAMGLLKFFSKPAPPLSGLPSGCFTMDRAGNVLVATVSSSFPAATVQEIGQHASRRVNDGVGFLACRISPVCIRVVLIKVLIHRLDHRSRSADEGDPWILPLTT